MSLSDGLFAGKMTLMKFVACALFCASLATAQQLPDGPGRVEMEKMCKVCHELARSVAPRQDRDGWIQTMTKMTAYGMKGTDKEYAMVLNYLAKNYPAPPIPPVNINTAPAIELESRLSLRRSQAAEILAWRSKNGTFKSFDDLRKLPGIDVEKLEAKKDKIVF